VSGRREFGPHAPRPPARAWPDARCASLSGCRVGIMRLLTEEGHSRSTLERRDDRPREHLVKAEYAPLAGSLKLDDARLRAGHRKPMRGECCEQLITRPYGRRREFERDLTRRLGSTMRGNRCASSEQCSER